jgi:polyhydroxybutyrate depolymerase
MDRCDWRSSLWLAVLLGCASDDGSDLPLEADTEAMESTSTNDDGGGTTGRGDESESDGPTSAEATTAGTGDDVGEPPPGCGDPVLPPGFHEGLELEHDGRTRRYDVIVPESIDASAAAPLVLNFHGYTGTPALQRSLSVIDPVAEAHGFVVVLPAGIDNSWNGGGCCGTAESDDVDDVGFARALVKELGEMLCIDERRVYAMGFSNGGYLSHRLACEATDIFAAIGPVGGVIAIPPDDCAPSRPISVLHVHGTDDFIVPYDGGGVNGFPGAPATMAGWAARNGCDATSEIVFEHNDVVCETWPNCDDGVEVTLCTFEGGHCWPGNASCIFGSSTTTISASERIADLFDQFSLP